MILDRDKLGAARFRAAYEYPYLTHALFALTPIACDDLPWKTMAVDDRWRLYVDTAFLTDTPVEKVAAVLVHEALHCVFDHSGRADTLGVDDHHQWNLACDAAINQILSTRAGTSGEPLPLPNPVLPADLGFVSNPNLPAEAMYTARDTPTNPTDGTGSDKSPDDEIGDEAAVECGSGAHGIAMPWENDNDNPPRPDGISPTEADVIRRQVAHEVTAAVAGQVKVHAGLARWADAVLRPQVNWRRQLAGAIGHRVGTTIGLVAPTYARPSRRTAAGRGVLLPGLRRPVPKVGVVVDTSGSMSSRQLDIALGEVAGILRSCGVRDRDVRVWACDTDATEISVRHRLTRTRLTGGGGTDMAAGIAAALAEPRFEPDFVVVLTDGETGWPATAPPTRIVVGLIDADPHAAGHLPEWARPIHITTNHSAEDR